MKSLLLFLPFFFLSITALKAQHAGFAIGLNGNEGNHVVVADDSDFDVDDGISIEVWVRCTDNVMDDQKLVGKSGTTFPLYSSYTLGIIDGQGVFELWDSEGDGILVKGGAVSQGPWIHLVGTFDLPSQTLKLYINGELVDESVSADIGPNMGYVVQPLIMGGAPWFYESKNLTGQMDEVRIWNAVIDEATINDWMHQDLNDTHPNWDALALYHKYNQGTGSVAADASGNNHEGDLSSVSTWATGDQPFKGDYSLLSSVPQGSWQNHPTAESAPLSISSNGLAGKSSVLIAHNDDALDVFFSDGPSGYPTAMGRVWKTTTQGTAAVFDVEADLTNIDLDMISDVVLVGVPPGTPFPNGTVFTGTLSGNMFTATNVTFEEGWSYTLAFNTESTSSVDVVDPSRITVFPNPSNGAFEVQIHQDGIQDALLEVFDMQGRSVHRSEVTLQGDTTLDINLGSVSAGTYALRISADDKVTVKRIVIE